MILAEILSHKQELFAGMADHKGIAGLEVGKFVLRESGHFIDHGTLKVYDLIVGQRQDIVFAGEICQAEGHLVMVVFPEIGILFHIFQKIMHPSHIPFEGKAQSAVLR